ncbi:hypothetical protein [Mesorhizobium sp. M0910]|uniref:hypothetical protein n=1 Tax=Mesorhizobium sp. M0910 TaxID=2957025 RepID=UPI00333AE410
MQPILTVTTPATSLALLTVGEARAALGLTTGARDADLTRAINRISAAIQRACNLATDGLTPPTLLSETLTDTFRLDCRPAGPLILSRRRVSAINSVVENDEPLVAADYLIDPPSGLFDRLCSDRRSSWPSGKIVVEYVAGFSTVPDDLKLAAETWLRMLWRDGYETPAQIADPMLKSEEIPGVLSRTWWVDPTKAEILPEAVRDMLCAGGYIETWVA